MHQPSLPTLATIFVTCVASAAAGQGGAARLPDGTPIAPCLPRAPRATGCVPGGPFLRGADKGPKNARPEATIALQTFYMDAYEVTVADYEACVAHKKCRPAHTAYRDYSRPKQPKVGVSWYHAADYCKAMGKHLPSEAQWEKAARGTDGRLYPWGNEPATCKRAVIMDHRGRSCGVTKALGGHPDKGRTFVVGTLPATQYGLYDMAGNSWEWVDDWYTPSYAACGADCSGIDPRGPCGGGAAPCKGYRQKIVRGGSWYWPAGYATTIFRRPHVPSNHPYHHFGFRCAASVDEARQLVAKERGK